MLLATAAAAEQSAPMATELVAFTKSQVGYGYIYGAYGQISTEAFRKGRAHLYPKSARLIEQWGEQWDGMPVYDCIGLLKAFLRITEASVAFDDINCANAFARWTEAWGPLEGARLRPGMVLFRIEGERMRVRHIGVYVGDGKVVHARGTRWGVVEEMLPDIFTHWAELSWLDYDTALEEAPAVTEIFLPVGSLARAESDDAGPVPVSETPYESGRLRPVSGYFADGTELLVLEAPDEMSRLVEGTGTKGKTIIGYVRLTLLREVYK